MNDRQPRIRAWNESATGQLDQEALDNLRTRDVKTIADAVLSRTGVGNGLYEVVELCIHGQFNRGARVARLLVDADPRWKNVFRDFMHGNEWLLRGSIEKLIDKPTT